MERIGDDGTAATVYVVGGGPAGLTAATALSRRGLRVVLLERANVVGGKVNSQRPAKYSLEHGVHGWWNNYINFDRLLRWSGIEPSSALRAASGTSILLPDGRRHDINVLPWNLPSPLFILVQLLRLPLLRLADVVRLGPFAVHMLSFAHEHDYQTYDAFSFQALMDHCAVPKRVQSLMLEPFIMSFDFAKADSISAACGLSGLQFYLVQDQQSVIPRWSKGLPAETIFGPIVDLLRQQGVDVSLNTVVDSLHLENGKVKGLRVQVPHAPEVPTPVRQTVARIALANIPEGSFSSVGGQSGTLWVRRSGAAVVAFSARCTHQGCTVAWDTDHSAFICPCHGGRFDRDGRVQTGPPTAPLDRLDTKVVGESVEVSGPAPPPLTPCSDVVIATDLESAKAMVAMTGGLPTSLRHDMGHLDTTPVIVVRLWFESSAAVSPPIESAITPGFELIDNYFCLNMLDKAIDVEGHVIEIQSYRAAHLLHAEDDTILNLLLQDLQRISQNYRRERLRHHTINRHAALFTHYGPGQHPYRPTVQTGVVGLHFAGDWTQADWSVWMMERGVVSGLRAANTVLRRRGLEEVSILRLPREHAILRAVRTMALLLRLTLFRSLPMTHPPSPADVSKHEERDHALIGWVTLLIATAHLLPLLASQFQVLAIAWELPSLLLSMYFFVHTEPEVRYRLRTWLRSWSDTATWQHRLMAGGAGVSAAAEWTRQFWFDATWLRLVFPLGLIGAGIIFYNHHHGHRALITRQHNIMAFSFIAAGLVWLTARFVPGMRMFEYAWPLLLGLVGYLFVTYTEEELDTAEGNGHVHAHDDGEALPHNHGPQPGEDAAHNGHGT